MLPIIRLAQPNSAPVRQRFATAGQWFMVTYVGEKTPLNRFKILHLLTRNVMSYFDPYYNQYVTARCGELEVWNRLVEFKLNGKPVLDGLELLVWLPHYHRLAMLQTLTRRGRRALDALCVGELYGLSSRHEHRNGQTLWIPSPERLNLPVDLTALPPDREEIQSKFVQGLPV